MKTFHLTLILGAAVWLAMGCATKPVVLDTVGPSHVRWSPPGSRGYLKNGWVTVPVIIAAGVTTTVHLQSTWSGPATLPDHTLVRLPDGRPVGWKYDASSVTARQLCQSGRVGRMAVTTRMGSI